MAILEQLGINTTVFFQFGLFVIAIMTLSSVAFAPYLRALEEREQRTKGGEDLAQELLKQAQELRTQYETKARLVNGDLKTIFDSYRDEANKECEKIIAEARVVSQKLMEENRARVGIEVTEAARLLKEEVAQVAQAITHKLIAK